MSDIEKWGKKYIIVPLVAYRNWKSLTLN